MAQLRLFFAPKTSGNTVLTLNTAILAQHTQKHKKVLLWQMTQYPDLHIYAGITPQKNWNHLIDFVGTQEFNDALISKVTYQQGVDTLLSPPKKFWRNCSVAKWQKILFLLQQKYDQIFVDLHDSVPEKIQDILLKQSEKICVTTLVDPASLYAVKMWYESQALSTQKKCNLIANQCPLDLLPTVNIKLNLESLPFLAAIPLAKKGLWEQVYQGFPLVFQKRNKWKKSLLKILE